MDIWQIDKLIIFIGFIIPGFISLKTYELFSPSDRSDSSKQFTEAITYSCVNYALLSWAIYFVETSVWRQTHKFFYALFYILVLFVFPVLWAYIWMQLRSSQIFQARAPHPIGKPWDYVFSQRQCYWVIITLKNGSRIAGKYASKSFTSSSPDKEQIYLEEAWVLNEDGGFDRPREQTAGLIVVSNEISTVELFKFSPEGGN